jgi:hypothetical protein
MVVFSSEDAGKTFKPALDDPFRFNACVMSTGHLLSSGNQTLVVWETNSQIRFARLVDGTAQSPVIRSVPGGANNRKHPAIAINREGAFVVTWAEGTGFNRGGSIAWETFDADGNATGQIMRTRNLPASSMPAAWAMPDNSFKIIY